MAFHRNNNGPNNRYNNNRPNNFRPRHTNNQHSQQNGQGRRHVNRVNHVFESNGPDGRVRGTAQQLVEKYVSMARDAHAGGDPVLMLNYYQHAEHYQRLYTEIMEENGAFERDREAQRAQYNQQPNIDAPNGDMNGGTGQSEANQGQNDPGAYNDRPQGQYRDERQNEPRQGQSSQRDMRDGRSSGSDLQYDPREPRQTNASQPETRQVEPRQNLQQPDQINQPQHNSDNGSMSTGGRVLARRPAPDRPENPANRPQNNQLQDDDVPSFLKQNVPIKQARPPVATAGTPAAEPVSRSPRSTAAAPKASVTDDTAPEPIAAAFGKRRAPVTRRTAAEKAADAAGSSDTTE